MAKKLHHKPEGGWWEYRLNDHRYGTRILTGKKEAKVLRENGATVQRKRVSLWEKW